MNRKHKKNISCECKCKCDGRKCKSDQKENNNKFRCECKNQIKHHMFDKIYKIYIWNHSARTCKNSKYLKSFIGDVIIKKLLQQ